jgi:PKHD-type hydroxylase
MTPITMSPMRNTNMSLVMHWPVFSPQECKEIVSQAKPTAWTKAPPSGAGNVPLFIDVKPTSNIERQPLPLGQNAYPLDQISFGIGQVNADHWRFELTGTPADDMPWMVKHSTGPVDEESWEVALGPSFTSSRKLCFILQLTDPDTYEGGDIVFHNVTPDPQSIRQQGTIVVFPGYWLHRISEIQRGVRHSIVGWIHGHNFR